MLLCIYLAQTAFQRCPCKPYIFPSGKWENSSESYLCFVFVFHFPLLLFFTFMRCISELYFFIQCTNTMKERNNNSEWRSDLSYSKEISWYDLCRCIFFFILCTDFICSPFWSMIFIQYLIDCVDGSSYRLVIFK